MPFCERGSYVFYDLCNPTLHLQMEHALWEAGRYTVTHPYQPITLLTPPCEPLPVKRSAICLIKCPSEGTMQIRPRQICMLPKGTCVPLLYHRAYKQHSTVVGYQGVPPHKRSNPSLVSTFRPWQVQAWWRLARCGPWRRRGRS